MNSLETIVRFFQTGGVFMIPILLVLAIGTAIVVERIITLARCRVNGERLWGQLGPFVQNRKLEEAARVCSHSRAPLYHVLSAGVRGMNRSLSREEIQGTMDEAMMEVVPRLDARLHYLPNLANVATLLGLLGTIIGLIEAFTAVSLADPSQKAAMLAKGISMAMNTTAFGLIVAIPLMLIYTFLQTRTNRIINTLDEFGLKLLNLSGQVIRESTITERIPLRANGGTDPHMTPREAEVVKGAGHAR